MRKMIPVIIISAITCLLLIINVLKNPVIKIGSHNIKIIYWAIPLLGAVILLFSGLLPLNIFIEGLTGSGSINPIKILILFISMTMLSIFLDEAGLFAFLASKALSRSGNSQYKLFLLLFILVSVLTVFTSNDIIILTFTPFISYFCKNAKINPIPYLFGEFVAANTWSMALIIGNPTNIYLASAAGISFGSYVFTMIVPTAFSGITALVMLLLIFRKSLSTPISTSSEVSRIKNRGLITLGVLHLSVCTILLVISSYIGLEMWYITLSFVVSLFVLSFVYLFIRRKDKKILLITLGRAPWELIPFVLSMFIIVLSLEHYDVTNSICTYLGQDWPVLKYGLASFLSANIMNNIPMAVAFSSIISHMPEAAKLPATYASIVGSNIGAYFTPLGALAGIMWAGILNKMGIHFPFSKYISYGIRISLPVLLSALLGLMLIL